MEEKRHSFGGSLGFVLAAAGSAVGLGNIWRFPFLAARDGGGLFLVMYLILAVTFGFTLLTAEIAIGRKTKQSPLTAYSKLARGWKPLGVISCAVPAVILPYYSAIGGWVIKYLVVYVTGQGAAAAQDGFFTGFITSPVSPIVYLAVFLGVTAFVIFHGVNRGIENLSKVLMPLLFLLVLGIAVFSLTISHTDESGVTRTGMEGMAIYVIPDISNMSLTQILDTLMDAMGQQFYSLSVAMGIMVAYGSYMPDKTDMNSSINQIEICDALVAFLAGVMIIPAVYTFMGREGMNASGPSLMFVTLPKVFQSMGAVGGFIGAAFFAMVLFAAVTSSVSIMEAVVSSFMDEFHISRKKALLAEFILTIVLGVVVCLGYNKLYFEVTLPNGAVGQILDILDYVSNNIMMPVGAIATCVLVGWVISPDVIIEEATKNGEPFRRRGMFRVMIKYIVPVMLFVLLVKAVIA